MNDGFVKVAAGAINGKVADPARNAQAIVAAAQAAAANGVRVLALPELCVTGATCGDLFFQQQLLCDALAVLKDICRNTASLPLVLVLGCPVCHNGVLYNCAVVVQQGKVLGFVPKLGPPATGGGGIAENRWFAPGFREPETLDCSDVFLRGVPIGAGLLFQCAEMASFVLGVTFEDNLFTPAPFAAELGREGAVLLATLSAGNEAAGRTQKRRGMLAAQAAQQHCAFLYASAGWGESTTDRVFSGHALVVENGAVLAEAPPFSGEVAISDIDTQRLVAARRGTQIGGDGLSEPFKKILFSLPFEATQLHRTFSPTPFVPEDSAERAQRCETVLNIQAHGLAARLEHVGAKHLILGVSGGLDSSVALLVAARAQQLASKPAADILAFTLPGFGTTQRTQQNAEHLAKALGASFETIDITATVRSHFVDIGHNETQQDVVYENAQARMRTLVLMDLANARGGLVIGTGDLSELSLGWATYGGDHLSMYAVNGGVPKTLLRHLIAHEAARQPELAPVLQDILETPVSPELLPPQNGVISQQTEEIVGPYELHDFFLYYMLRWGFAPRKILRLAKAAFGPRYDEVTLLHWLGVFYKRFFAHQFKRSCLPDGPAVGSVSLSPRGGLCMPSDAAAAAWLREVEQLEQNSPPQDRQM